MKMKYAKQQLQGMENRNKTLELKYSKLLSKYEQILELGRQYGGSDFDAKIKNNDLDLDSLAKKSR